MSSSLPLWKVVTAEVRVHLNPSDVGAGSSTGRAVASREAFASLLLRYSPELGGVVVSHGSLDFGKEPVFAELVGGSPFARVRAKAELLLFAPSKDAILTGVVTYVGPDHVALSVLSTFHTIVALESAPPGYVFSIDESTLERSWRNEEYPTIQIGTALRLAVESMRASKNGLFHIRGRIVGEASEGLGVLEDPQDIRVAGGVDPGKEEGEGEGPELEVGRFMRRRTVDMDERRNASDFGEENGVLGSFSDPLIGTVGVEEEEQTQRKRKKKKKAKKGEKRKADDKRKKKKERKESGDKRETKGGKEGTTENPKDEDREVRVVSCDEMHGKLSRKKRRRKREEKEARRLGNSMGNARKPVATAEEVGHESFSSVERAPGDNGSTRKAIKVEPKPEIGILDGSCKRKREKMGDSEWRKKRRKIKQEVMAEDHFENGTKELTVVAKTEIE